MAREYFKISVDYDNESSRLTKKTVAEIEALLRDDPLLAANVLLSPMLRLSSLYEQAVDRLFDKRDKSVND